MTAIAHVITKGVPRSTDKPTIVFGRGSEEQESEVRLSILYISNVCIPSRRAKDYFRHEYYMTCGWQRIADAILVWLQTARKGYVVSATWTAFGSKRHQSTSALHKSSRYKNIDVEMEQRDSLEKRCLVGGKTGPLMESENLAVGAPCGVMDQIVFCVW
ncbi:hypothetical protein Tco_1078694 [Tanacetum coccineum]|uniref:Uncharacterized protein n=1 Tax=Tanacetum coccineum TaxID=301880 RepID=A0ABQ5HR05_9ASTR